MATMEKTVRAGSGPSSAQTLFQLLETIAVNTDKGVTIYGSASASLSSSVEGPKAVRLSYLQLLSDAKSKASLFRDSIPIFAERKVVLIYLDHHVDSIPWFWAVVHAGLLPALLPPLSSNSQQRDQHLKHLTALLEDPIVLTTEALLTQAPQLQQLRAYTIESLQSNANKANGVSITNGETPTSASLPQGDEPCVLMLTSGSTGNSKAVSLTVPQILASVRGKGNARHVTDKWVFLNWIGLDHVANLTEIHLNALYHGAEQVQVQSSDVISDPSSFLRLLHEHRVSYSFAPNFFLALLSKKLAAAEPSDPIFSVDLSSLEGIVSGGEANVVETAKTLTKQLNAVGAQGPTIFIGYGLTEACAAITYEIFDLQYETREGHEFASVGKTIEGANIRIHTPEGTPAEPYQVGELQLSGDVVFKSYYRDTISTANSFTKDGWFVPGDQGYVDREGKINLIGRAKDTLIINGVNYSSQDVENTLEAANLPGTVSSYFVTFPHRPIGNDTEGYVVIYSPQNTFEIPELRDQAVEAISRTASSLLGVRPDWVVPLPTTRLEKSSLGKLSRSKLKKEFDSGGFDDAKVRSKLPIQSSQPITRVAPTTGTEKAVVDVLSEMLEMPADIISVSQTIFELGVTSVSLFRFERLLRTRFNIGTRVSIITFLNSPVIQHIANAIDGINSAQYNPVALIQSRGNKHPLWLVHPASGNVLAFLPLARTMTDRPLYALSSRGLGANEYLFSSIAEMADTYRGHVKRVQPEGPYALMGYSLGTTVAYELAKRLEAYGDEVVFCGALDSPPHIIPLLGHLDWTMAAVRVAYFLELIAQDDIPVYEKKVRDLPPKEVVERLLELARPEQLAKLQLSPEQLMAIVNVTDNFGNMGKKYVPDGQINCIDVFYCTPLHSVCLTREKWVNEQLAKWQDFSRQSVNFVECEGDHADMVNAAYVEGFEIRLNAILEKRGL